MFKSALLGVFLILNVISYTQVEDLCGIWLGHNYQCWDSTLNGQLVNQTQVIRVEHIGDSVVATKITGDGCVPAGNVTWYGNYVSETFNATALAGNLENPASVFVDRTITVENDTSMFSNSGLVFSKANCRQLDSLSALIMDSDVECHECQESAVINMPNVFTPRGVLNNTFKPITYVGVNNPEITIFNRWGVLVATINSLDQGWDGMGLNGEYTSGVYFWILSYIDDFGQNQQEKGFVTLVQ